MVRYLKTPLSKALLRILWLSVIAGCATSPRSIERIVLTGNFSEARARLERIDAGQTPDPNLSERKREVRDLFRKQVELRYLDQAKTEAENGMLHDAIRTVRSGLELCPWSSAMQIELTEYDARMTQVVGMERRWESVAPGDIDSITTAREYLVDTELLQRDWRISDSLKGLRASSLAIISDHWADELAAYRIEDDADPIVTDLTADLRFEEFDALKNTDNWNLFLGILSYHYETANEHERRTLIEYYSEIVKAESEYLPAYAIGTRLLESAQETNEHWFWTNLPRLFDSEPTMQTISVAERVVSNAASILDQSWQRRLARLHLRAAQQKSGLGVGSVLSLLHLSRAQQLDEDVASDLKDLYETVFASLASSENLVGNLTIRISGTIDSNLAGIVRDALYGSITNRTLGHFLWISNDSEENGLNLEIKTADFVVPEPKDLRTINSSFHSHNEQVPNPARVSLEFQLDTARRNVDNAQRNYDNAVRNYNLNQTNWAYQNALNAENSYNYAIRNYNNLVDRYNATPATITRPVYRDYSFQQGTVRFGWRLSIGIRSTEGQRVEHSTQTVSDFVRIGAHSRDVNPNYRRDDPLEIDVSASSALFFLRQAADEISATLHDDVKHLVNVGLRAGIDASDIDLIQMLLHPWGWSAEQIQDHQPSWVFSALSDMSLPDLTASPQSIVLNDPPRSMKQFPDESSFLDSVRNEIVYIETRMGNMSSSASGALIGPDGLILTCAHCIPGEEVAVSIASDPDSPQFDADILFVNQLNDVAVIRATGLQNSSWLPVRLDEAVSINEPVIAAGNPSIGDGTTATAAVTQGAVATPLHDDWGSPRIVVDLTIASGSSGGPLISMLDGKVVGVVVAVSAPEFGNSLTGRASSGSFALVAPATNFDQWLGFQQ